MPFTTNPVNTTFIPTNPLPQHLAHKPVYALPYQQFDGIYAGNTDIRYISIGLAQYDSGCVSIKTMRHTGGKWSRQSEELPLHRPIDITIFIAKTIFTSQNSIVDISKGTFTKQDDDISISPEQRSFGELASYNNFLNINSSQLKDQLNTLRKILNELSEQGTI